MSKKLSGVAGIRVFQVCMVANRTNQNIRLSQSRKNKQLPNVNHNKEYLQIRLFLAYRGSLISLPLNRHFLCHFLIF